MLETLGTILAALSAIIAFGVIIVCGVIWASRRRMDEAAADAARKSSGGKGEE